MLKILVRGEQAPFTQKQDTQIDFSNCFSLSVQTINILSRYTLDHTWVLYDPWSG